ncbi:MAG: type II toxin-antitoxin system RelE/ParE family toxin [Terracidiphilus sp.]|jgi:plasmid maintenance system killer protein
MKVWSFSHKGLKKLYEEDSAKGVPPDTVDKLRKMLTFLDAMAAPMNSAICRLGRRIN